MSVNIDQWLRNEVLPELKKNGVYSCRITPDQQEQIKQAILAYSEKEKITDFYFLHEKPTWCPLIEVKE